MDPDNIVLEHLRAIRTDISDIKADIREIKLRVGHLEEIYSSVSRRMDRYDDRFERIERRLELESH